MNKITLLFLTLILLGCSYPAKITFINNYEFPIKIQFGNSFAYQYRLPIDSLASDSLTLDTIFILDPDTFKNEIKKNEVKTLYSNIQATHTNDKYALKYAHILDINGNKIETIRYSAGLIYTSDSIQLPFIENNFRDDKAYQSYEKLVEQDSLFLKYIEIQDLYAHHKHKEVVHQVNQLEFDRNTFGNLKVRKFYKNLMDGIYDEHFLGFYTLGILSANRLNNSELINKYWQRIKTEYPIRAEGLSRFDLELANIIKKTTNR